MDLFKRLPSLRFRKPEVTQIISSAEQEKYPALKDDLATLNAEVLPRFQTLDEEALRFQNTFRLQQLSLIFGGALATILGGFHAVLENAWIGVGESVLAAALSAVAMFIQATKAQERFSTNRLKAETLRSEYFLFLGRVGIYADDQPRRRNLLRRIAEVAAREQTK